MYLYRWKNNHSIWHSDYFCKLKHLVQLPMEQEDRKSTRLKLQSRRDLVCRLLLEKKKSLHTFGDNRRNQSILPVYTLAFRYLLQNTYPSTFAMLRSCWNSEQNGTNRTHSALSFT